MPPSAPNATPPPSVTPSSPSADWASWRRLTQVYVGRDTESAEIRARLVQWVTMLSPYLMLANVVSGLLVALAVHAPLPGWLRWSWCAALCGMCTFGFINWLRYRTKPPTRVGPSVIRKSALHAAILAILWSLLSWALFPTGDVGTQLMLAGVMTAMIAGGGFVLSPLAPAAAIFSLIIGISSSILVARYNHPKAGVMSMLMAAYTAIVVVATLFSARRAASALRAEREAERQGQLVGLLLRDFESQSADVLWEIDAKGCFGRISPKLQTLMQIEGINLGEQSLLGWVEAHSVGDNANRSVAQLRQAFNTGQAFRLRELSVVIDDTRRWWAITARPLVDETGVDQGWRGVITDVTMEHDAHERMRELALVDSLTGLANRMQLRDRLQLALEAAQRRPCALLCLNMDHFKRINDMYGHGAGDQVLREAGRRLQKLTRVGDLVARAGGDEFAIVLADIDSTEQALAFGQRIVEELNRTFPHSAGAIHSGASVGVVIMPAHGRTVDELLANADLALSAAKAGGRSRCELFHVDMGERLRLRLTLERDLRGAITRNELLLHWQPQVEAVSWRVSGCEALIRWQHPDLGMVPPLQFVPLAEETGLIVEVGEWVMNEACRVGVAKLPGLMISVNVSPVQVVRDDFVNMVRKALSTSGLPAQRLEIEITESLFIDASPKALHNLETLRQMGVRVALDDFGTGYSSLAYLRQFPFDTLKIDRAFVRELVTQHDARAIVRSIVELAAALGMSTIAEGVEEPAQYELLRRAGCFGVQGYLIARPMPIDQIEDLLDSWSLQRAPRFEAVPDSVFAPLGDTDFLELETVPAHGRRR